MLEKAENTKAKANILIIDDDQGITRTFAKILQKKGYETDTAVTGMEAIQKAISKRFDLALIDICLPDMNGMDLINKLDDHGGKLVKIVITGFPSLANDTAHPDGYLLKPVKPQDLLSLIDQKI